MIPIDQIQSHTNDRSVALSIKASKITARLLAKAMQAFFKKARSPSEKHGKQSIKSLTKNGASLENVEISGDNIGSFKKTARKYNIDFALKKDKSTEPPSWTVFFKAKDSKSIEMAFKEFSSEVLKSKDKPSASAELARFKEIASGVAPAIVKPKDKGEFEL